MKMLFKIAFRNIQKSVRDYLVYFLTLCMAVACFYMFNSLDSQAAVMQMNRSAYEEMELLMKVMSVASVFVAIVLGFLIVHANRYLINRRKKEFGIYLTLGMGKANVSAILLWETVIVGIISLAAGLCLGIFGSQLMSIFTAKMFQADMSAFHFIFSKDAFIKSCIYYGIIYGAVLVLNTFMISRFRLIALFQARSKNEKSVMRNSVFSVIVFAAAVAVLIYSYINLAKGVTELKSARELVVLIVLVLAATFFIFWSVSGFALNIMQRRKGFWYRSTNMFVFRQLAGKVNTTVVSMTLVCLMMFFAITSLGSSLSLKTGIEKQLEANTPVDVNVRIYNNDNESVLSVLENAGFDTDKLKDTAEANVYRINDFTTEVFLGDIYEQAAKAHPNVIFDYPEEIVKVSEYNKIAAAYGRETLDVAADEYVCVADFDTMVEIINEALKDGNDLKIGGKIYHSKYDECRFGFLQMSGSNINTGFLVVPDSCDLSGEEIGYRLLAANYNVDTEAQRAELDREFEEGDIWKKITATDMSYFEETRTQIYASARSLVTTVIFVAIYIGITFLIASAALLSLNQLTEAQDGIAGYEILKKVGCDGRMIDGALFKQSAVFFLLPLGLAVIHSGIGFKFFASMATGVNVGGSLVMPIIITSLIIGGIYAAYFLAAYAGSRRIVRG